VRRFYRPRVIEVGTWLGRSALAMREAGAGQVHCIDTWRGTDDPADETHELGREHGQPGTLRAFCRNVGPALGDGIHPYVGASLFWADVWPWKAQLIFLDADHRYEAARADIEAWTPHVRRDGGVLCGHDFANYWPGVKRAVEETGNYQVCGTVWFRTFGELGDPP
jgi:hypothetical protein